MSIEEFPRDFPVEEARHKQWRDLVDKDDSPFKGKTLADVFLYSMALGFTKRKRKELSGSTKGSISSDAFQDRGKWLIRAVAVQEENDLFVLTDKTKVVKIAVEYANGGFDDLLEIVYSGDPRDAEKRLESHLIDFLQSKGYNNN